MNARSHIEARPFSKAPGRRYVAGSYATEPPIIPRNGEVEFRRPELQQYLLASKRIPALWYKFLLASFGSDQNNHRLARDLADTAKC